MIDWLRLCGQMAHNCLGTVCIADVDSVSFGLKLPISALSTTNTWAEFRCVFFWPKGCKELWCRGSMWIWYTILGIEWLQSETGWEGDFTTWKWEAATPLHYIYIYLSLNFPWNRIWSYMYLFVCFISVVNERRPTLKNIEASRRVTIRGLSPWQIADLRRGDHQTPGDADVWQVSIGYHWYHRIFRVWDHQTCWSDDLGCSVTINLWPDVLLGPSSFSRIGLSVDFSMIEW